jgi:hypothetical protein
MKKLFFIGTAAVMFSTSLMAQVPAPGSGWAVSSPVIKALISFFLG